MISSKYKNIYVKDDLIANIVIIELISIDNFYWIIVLIVVIWRNIEHYSICYI